MSIKLENGTGKEEALLQNKSIDQINNISLLIQNGATTFLLMEYLYLGIFLLVFSIIILLIDGFRFYTLFAFVLGALTSVVSGYIGMWIATRANGRVAFQAYYYGNKHEHGQKFSESFNVAFRGGCVMGFCLVSLALINLTFLIMFYHWIINPTNTESYIKMFEYLAGYGLGGSTVALFCRVGGGIYTKAADVGADLVGKVALDLPEDSPENPATIADNVGDNVGDIAGMGSDLFGSFAEATCAALLVSGTSVELTKGANFYFPLPISAAGILVCIVTSFFATNIMLVTEQAKIENTLQWQLIISTLLLTPVIVIFSLYCLPSVFYFTSWDVTKPNFESHSSGAIICLLSGLWAGLLIGFITDYYTSNKHEPTQRLAQSCKSGAAINIIQGLALGYLSCIIPILAIAVTIYLSFTYCGMYGLALAALGMLSNLSISLAIDAYGPISDNAGGIASMSDLPEDVRDTTDALDAAGNTTAAVGKGFAIGSACLVSLALFGAFVTRTQMTLVNILEPIQIACLIIGAMMPYAFSALTMKSVGTAADKMCSSILIQVGEKKRQLKENTNPNIKEIKDLMQAKDYEQCIQIATEQSLSEMILPGVMVIFTPIVLGSLFGPKAVSGYLSGVIVSGVQMAISSSNSGGAWDNAKKFIEGNKLEILHHESEKALEDPAIRQITESDREGKKVTHYPKHSGPHKAAVVGDTVGDPLKDTSGPSLNILIKLSAIVSVVFGSFFLESSIWTL